MSKWRAAIENAPLIARGIYEYHVASRLGPLPAREWLFPLTYRCNSRCVMCNIWQGSHEDELSTADWEPILADPFFGSVQGVSLTGGEPTLRQDLPQLAELLVRRLPSLRRMTLTTNALSPPHVVQQCEQLQALCAAHGIHLYVGVSLDGIGPLHDEMRNVPGAFERVVTTLDGLQARGLRSVPGAKRRGLPVGINCTLTSRNLRGAEDMQRWCTQRGLDVNYIVASFADSYYGNTETEADLQFSAEQRRELATFLQQLAARRSPGNPAAYFYADAARMLTRGAARTTPCVFQKDGFILDARGDMQYCMYGHILGNVRNQSAGTLFRAPENMAHRQEIITRQCATCTITCFLEVGLAKDLCRFIGFLLRGLRSVPGAKRRGLL